MRKLLNEELPRLSKEEFKQQEKKPIVIVLDNVRSHLNVGSIFRTADAFLIQGMYLCGITGLPPHRDIHKTALGATETVEWKYFKSAVEAIQYLKELNYIIVSIEQTERATRLNEFIPRKEEKYAIVFGNEVDGVTQDVIDLSDLAVEIPQYGMKHSLNVAVSAGITMWDVSVKMSMHNIFVEL
ncbi:MAG: RNA methyltransferase [Bacteroidota bacterium]